MPFQHLGRPKFLKRRSAQVWDYLLFGELPVTLDGLRREVGGVQPLAKIVAHRDLCRLNVCAVVEGMKLLGKLALRVLPLTSDGEIANLRLPLASRPTSNLSRHDDLPRRVMVLSRHTPRFTVDDLG